MTTRDGVLMRKTMIKDEVGKVRATTFDLPPEPHSFGREVARDLEDAGAVLSQWVVSKPSSSTKTMTDICKTNAKAIHSGIYDSKGMRDFAKNKPIKIKQSHANNEKLLPPQVHSYGQATQMSENVGNLIKARYTDFNVQNADYPDVSTLVSKSKRVVPKPTKASLGHQKGAVKALKTPHTSSFKMKKFKDVRSRVAV